MREEHLWVKELNKTEQTDEELAVHQLLSRRCSGEDLRGHHSLFHLRFLPHHSSLVLCLPRVTLPYLGAPLIKATALCRKQIGTVGSGHPEQIGDDLSA